MTCTEHIHCRTWAVVLNWNQPAMTLDCVRSLLAQTVPVRVLVVDNGSTMANRAALRDGLPANCDYIQNPQNLGFAGGMNVGIRAALRAGTEFIWLMNNDAFPEPGCLAALHNALESDHRLAVVTPRLYGSDGREQHAGGQVLWQSAEHEALDSFSLSSPVSGRHWLTGTALLFRAKPLQSIGGFDHRFFAYWEEVDLMYRMANVGWFFRAVPEANCLHVGNVSSGGSESPIVHYLQTRNACLYTRKHAPLIYQPFILCRIAERSFRMIGSLCKCGFKSAATATITGLRDGIFGRSGRPSKLCGDGIINSGLLRTWWRAESCFRHLSTMLPVPPKHQAPRSPTFANG